MIDSTQIPYLIKLLDDDSSDVQKTISQQLSVFGLSLKDELKKLDFPLNSLQKKNVDFILQGHKRVWLKEAWSQWLQSDDASGGRLAAYNKFEQAVSILAEFLCRHDSDVSLRQLLDGLASDYKAAHGDADPKQLAKFLFKEKGLKGNEEDYYNPQNSNLVYVICEKKGIPISLTTVYILVGLRLGIEVGGCHFPGHFLARVLWQGKNIFVDCFNGGQFIQEKDLLSMQERVAEEIEIALRESADTYSMVRRFLANLIRAYQILEDEDNSEALISLFQDMDIRVSSKEIGELTPEDIIHYAESCFKSGQCVAHSHYGYRGIIVDVDLECKATDDWYYGNQTQPSRHQPWYHVLVHGSEQVTYVAESNLKEDTSNEKMTHPLLTYFFRKTKEGRYVRNDNPWPETDF